jgi:hypothetical protein
MKPADISKLPKVEMLGTEGVLIESLGGDHQGMDGKEVKGAGLLGIVCLLENRALFVKMVGPADLVKRQKQNFLAFSRSLRVEE